MAQKFFTPKNILSMGADYNIIFGERSNGKTYGTLKYCLEEYFAGRGQMALIRRWMDDFTGKRGTVMFDALVKNGEISKITKGQYDNVFYRASQWWLCRWDEKTEARIMDNQPFAYGFGLNSNEHDKSTSYPGIKNVVFDEFIARRAYIPDEFILFINTLSTIIRNRKDVKIFMLGNTISKFCPYFNEMGLTNILKMKQGTIDIYTYGDSDLKVAVEYVAPTKGGKKSDKYFAFNNPKLKMVTSGAWEMDIYPHLPIDYGKDDRVFTYYIKNQTETLACEIIMHDTGPFTYIHRKTTPIRKEEQQIVYSREHTNNPYHRRSGLIYPNNELDKRLNWFFKNDRVFYQSNDIGEVVADFITWAKQERRAI